MTKEFKKPDLKAPRCRSQVHTVLNQKLIDQFVEKNPKFKTFNYRDAQKILKAYHEKIYNEVIENRDGVELPESLGILFIGTCFSPKKYNTDFGSSIKNETKIRHKNFESDNFLAKIFYTNYHSKYKFKHRDLWSFDGVREFKRSVASTYPDNWKLYIQVENGIKISAYLRKAKKNDWFKNREQTFVIDPLYNEFDIN
jgi:hypothetical protein